MRSKVTGYYCFLFFLIQTNAVYSSSTKNLLQRLLHSESSKPLVIFVNYDKSRNSDLEDLFKNVQGDGQALNANSNEEVSDYADRSEEREDGNGDYIDEVYDEERQDTFEKERENDHLYFLSYLLRNVLDEHRTTSSLEENLEPTKLLLRSALRSRCRKVDSCVRKCPRKKPSCPHNCQQVFDNLNLCRPPPDPCERKCGGKTMPPSWRF